MSRTIAVAFTLFVSELWPFGCVSCLFQVIYILVLSVTCPLSMISSCNVLGIVLGKDDVTRTRMIVPPVLVSKLCPFDIFPKKSCTTNNSVTVKVEYLHETLKECISDHGDVSRTNTVHFCL